VSREVTRHGGRPGYRAHDADDHAWDSALRPKRCLLALNRKLRDLVASKLMLDWSPGQISGWLKTQYPDDDSLRVSHETIYRSRICEYTHIQDCLLLLVAPITISSAAGRFGGGRRR
jgi:transposase, IS30 family